MKNCFLILLSISFSMMAQQNLVPNWSFENLTSCPGTGYGKLHHAAPWFQPNYTYLSAGGSVDLYNACIPPGYNVPANGYNYQQAKTGQSYIAITTFTNVNADSNQYREYCEIKLNDTLMSGKKYCVKYFVSNINILNCSYVVSKIEGYFSNDSLLTYNPNEGVISTVSPQITSNNGMITDTSGWTETKSIYLSTGDELFFTIGNFQPFYKIEIDTMCSGGGFVSPAYYFVDDVSVYEIPEVYAGIDTTICPWHSTTLGPQNVRADVQYSWQPTMGLSNPNIANPIASPMVNTTYVLTVTDTNQWACYSQMYDTVTVTVSGCLGITDYSKEIATAKVFPNPSKGAVIFSLVSEGKYELTIWMQLDEKLTKNLFQGAVTVIITDCLRQGFIFLN
jgi:hypothetical protein